MFCEQCDKWIDILEAESNKVKRYDKWVYLCKECYTGV